MPISYSFWLGLSISFVVSCGQNAMFESIDLLDSTKVESKYDTTVVFSKNVIFIMADDLGFESFEYYGGKTFSWGNLDFLADNGLIYNHAYATPLCAPTRAALITGLYNFRNYNDFNNALVVTDETPSIAKLYKAAGYRTAVFGKWHINNSLDSPYKLGFDHYTLYGIADSWGSPHYGGWFYKDGQKLQKNEYGPDMISKDVLRYIEKNRSNQFFVYYPMLLPHRPWQRTPISVDDYGEESLKYYPDMVKYIDVLIGRLVDKLSELDLLENTIIIFTSDNGANKATRVDFMNETVYGGKSLTTDFGIHVPLIVYNNNAHREYINDVVGVTDYYRTFEVLLNQNKDNHCDAISFAHSITKASPSEDKRKFNYIYYDPKRKVNPIAKAVFVHDSEYKLYEDGRFYSLKEDIHERSVLNDLTPEQMSIKHEMAAVMDSISLCQN